MSRCFPFPPAGYEKKARPEDANLLTKEKHKEKHKRDKEDKERKEKKEKRDKERSEEKHSEKTAQRDKHKDQKDKDKDKKQSRQTDKRKIVGPLKNLDDKKSGSKDLQSDETNAFLLKLDKRIRNNDGEKENRKVEEATVTHKSVASLQGKVVEGSTGILAEGNEKLGRRENDEKESGQNKKFEATSHENGFSHNFMEGNHKKIGVVRLVDNRRNDGKRSGQSDKVEAMYLENVFFQNFMDGQRKIDGDVRLVDGYIGKQGGIKCAEKNKHQNSDHKGDRQKDREGEKKIISKDKNRKKVKEREEKVKEKELNKEWIKIKESGKHAVEGFGSKGTLGKRKEFEMNAHLHEDGLQHSKLPRLVSCSPKAMENGTNLDACPTALHLASQWQSTVNNQKVHNKVSVSQPAMENGEKTRSCQTAANYVSEHTGVVNNSKVNNKVLSPPLVVENGRKSETCQTTIQSSPERQRTVSSFKEDKKEPRINGLIVAPPANVCLSSPSSAPVQVKDMVEATMTDSHPDSKYLSQILAVPAVEWSGFDNQEWLFGRDEFLSKNPKICSHQAEETKQVWAKAIRVLSADVTAMPYVIPY